MTRVVIPMQEERDRRDSVELGKAIGSLQSVLPDSVTLSITTDLVTIEIENVGSKFMVTDESEFKAGQMVKACSDLAGTLLS